MKCFVITLFLLGFLLTAPLTGQIVDSFSDNNFTADPPWAGDVLFWQIVPNSDAAAGATDSYTLRLNGPATPDQTAYLYSQRSGSWGDEQSWGFWLGRRQRGIIGNNYSCVWLWADNSLLKTSAENGSYNPINGYRIKFGRDIVQERILLQKIVNGEAVTILASAQTVPKELADYGFLVRVTRTMSSQWSLFTSALPTADGSGAVATAVPSKAITPLFQGSVTDNQFTHFDNGYFGVSATHGASDESRTAAEFDQFYFDRDSDSSLPITLNLFSSDILGSLIRLVWKTESEIDNAGFIILRATEEAGEYEQISDLIPGAGSSTSMRKYSFFDQQTIPGQQYWYKLVQIDTKGARSTFGPIAVTITGANESDTIFPDSPGLVANYPNPFNPGTNIIFEVSDENQSPITLEVFDAMGRITKTLANRAFVAGTHIITWDGLDDRGNPAPSGTYFVRMSTAGGEIDVLKLTKLE